MQNRERERNIPDPLARETVKDGLIMEKRDAKNLHLSDHLVVISTGYPLDKAGLTTYRHAITGTWRADSGQIKDTEADSYVFNTSYFFYQVVILSGSFGSSNL
jgi:hypothetical protein